MFRFSLLVFVTLIFGITAKPNKPWNKLVHEVLQDTVMSKGLKEKMSLGVEVEPPEEMQEIDYDFGPDMKIWSMMGQEKQPLKAQDVLAGLNIPSVSNLLKVQIQNLGTLPVDGIQAEYNQEPEEDRDDIDHPVFSEVEEPKQDYEVKGELQRYLAPLMADKGGAKVRVYLQPEEDLDDLYHKDVPLSIPYQDDTELGRPVDVPSQRRHSEPEEDLDNVYHQ